MLSSYMQAMPAIAQESAAELKAREDWLRYSSLERRLTRKSVLKRNAESPTPKDQVQGSVYPQNPGAASVESSQFVLPNWNYSNNTSQRNEVYLGAGYPGAFYSTQPRPYFGRHFYPGGVPGRTVFQAQFPQGSFQTGPSPSSGNYYQPASREQGASGSYFASPSPWVLPLIAPNNNSQTFWGPEGNPLSKPPQ